MADPGKMSGKERMAELKDREKLCRVAARLKRQGIDPLKALKSLVVKA